MKKVVSAQGLEPRASCVYGLHQFSTPAFAQRGTRFDQHLESWSTFGPLAWKWRVPLKAFNDSRGNSNQDTTQRFRWAPG